MTISTTKVAMALYTGNGSTTSFPYDFKIQKTSQLTLTETDLAGVESVLVEGTDYSVTGAGAAGGGDVVLTTALTNNHTLLIERDTALTQDTDLVTQGPYTPVSLENALDKLTQIAQELDAVTLAVGTAASRAGFVLSYDSAGDAETNILAQQVRDVIAGALATGAAITSDTFTGDGIQTAFVMSVTPPGVNSVFATIDGVLQEPTADFTLAGATVTFTTAPADQTTVVLRNIGSTVSPLSGASTAVTYTPSWANAVARNVALRLMDRRSVHDFGAVGDGVADDRQALVDADGIGTPVTLRENKSYLIGSNLTLTNPLVMPPGSDLKPSGGVTVTLNGGLIADRNDWSAKRTGSGTLAVGIAQEVNADWWQAKSTNLASPNDTVQLAISGTARGSTIRFRGQYASTPVDVIADENNQATATNRDAGKSFVGIGGGIPFRFGSQAVELGAEIILGNAQNDDLMTFTGQRISAQPSRFNLFIDGLGFNGNKANQTKGAITGATQANPVVVTELSHPHENGDTIRIASVAGMTEINGREFTVANKTADTYELSGEDGTGHTAYSSGGQAWGTRKSRGLYFDSVKDIHFGTVFVTSCLGHNIEWDEAGAKSSNVCDANKIFTVDSDADGIKQGGLGDPEWSVLHTGGHVGDGLTCGSGLILNQCHSYVNGDHGVVITGYARIGHIRVNDSDDANVLVAAADEGCEIGSIYSANAALSPETDAVDGHVVFTGASLAAYVGKLHCDDTGTAAKRHAYFLNNSARNVIGSYTFEGTPSGNRVQFGSGAEDDGNQVIPGPSMLDIAYAASVTPDPWAARALFFDQLTGDISLTNFAVELLEDGHEITTYFEADGTNRDITWNARWNHPDGATTTVTANTTRVMQWVAKSNVFQLVSDQAL